MVQLAAGKTLVTAELLGALVGKTQTSGVLRQVEPRHQLSINLDVVVPKSQHKAHLFGSDSNTRLRSALAVTGVCELQPFPQCGSCMLGTWVSDTSCICDVSHCALLSPCQHSQNLECFVR